jgi:hypothetical protein
MEQVAHQNSFVSFSDPDFTGTWTLNGNILTTTYVEEGVTHDNLQLLEILVFTAVNNGEVVGSVGNPVFNVGYYCNISGKL